MEGSFTGEIMKLAMTTTEKQIPLEPHLAFCYSMLMKNLHGCVFGKASQVPTYLLETELQSKYIFGFKQCLGLDEFLDAFCVLLGVLRALDTVEDDTTIAPELKVPILENFHHHIYDRDLPISCGTKHHKVLMDKYYHISTALLGLQKGYQNAIENIVKIMGAEMAKFVLKEVETVADYNEYCYTVTVPIVLGLSEHLLVSNLENLTSEHLSSSMGVMIQKVHFIQDFFEDMHEIPKGRMYWPRQIWSKYVDKLEDLLHEDNSEKALYCLNDMVTDALSDDAVGSLEYLSTLRHPGVFKLYAIIQIIFLEALGLFYNNIEVFRGRVTMSPGRCGKVVLGTKAMSDVYEAFYDFSSTLRAKIDRNDPNATKTLRCVEEIQKVCEDSGLLNQRVSSFQNMEA